MNLLRFGFLKFNQILLCIYSFPALTRLLLGDCISLNLLILLAVHMVASSILLLRIELLHSPVSPVLSDRNSLVPTPGLRYWIKDIIKNFSKYNSGFPPPPPPPPPPHS